MLGFQNQHKALNPKYPYRKAHIGYSQLEQMIVSLHKYKVQDVRYLFQATH